MVLLYSQACRELLDLNKKNMISGKILDMDYMLQVRFVQCVVGIFWLIAVIHAC